LSEESQPRGFFHTTTGHRAVPGAVLARNHRHGVRGVRELAIQTRHDGVPNGVVGRRQGKRSGLGKNGPRPWSLVRMECNVSSVCFVFFVAQDSLNYWGSDGLQNVSSPYKASWTEQFSAVIWRSWLSIKKEPALTKIRLVQTIVRNFATGNRSKNTKKKNPFDTL